MLYVFHVETGTMMTFEMSLAIERSVYFHILSYKIALSINCKHKYALGSI